MGLDWKVRKRDVVDMYERVGSYSTWQYTRKALLKAARAYAEAKELKTLDEELAKWEQTKDFSFFAAPINYKYMEDHPPKKGDEHYELLFGLHQFIHHSDTDGRHAPGIAAKILGAYQTVAAYLSGEDEKELWDKILVPLLEASIKHKVAVVYC